MNTGKYFNKIASALLIFFAAASLAFAQTGKTANPRQEKLLNNLKILMWQDASTDKATVKLRIHSGAAFDTLGKEGTMALLADALFPNESVKEFFAEDLGGSLSVESNYDYIQISAIGSAEQILTILETVAAAVTKPTLDKETTAKVKAARLARIQELEKNPAYVADLAVAKRLFGDYPYGRSAEGTTESLAGIDFADLILAKQKFLTADNATIAVSGNIKYDYVLKAVRQLYGGWEKADKKVPATFAQPSAFDTTPLTLKSSSDNLNEIRLAFRGAARNALDFWAFSTFARVLENRIGGARVRQNSDFLPAIFLARIPVQNLSLGEPMARSLKTVFDGFAKPPITPAELAEAKSFLAAERQKKSSDEKWLDTDTFKIVSVESDARAADAVTISDVQKASEKLRQSPMAAVVAFREGNMNSPLLK